MSITTVLFDMDGTLLPMNQDEFVDAYFKTITDEIAPLGYEPKKLIDSIIKGTFAMVKGDGTRLNQEIFWEVFCGIYGEKALDDKPAVIVEEEYKKKISDVYKMIETEGVDLRTAITSTFKDELAQLGVDADKATSLFVNIFGKPMETGILNMGQNVEKFQSKVASVYEKASQ